MSLNLFPRLRAAPSLLQSTRLAMPSARMCARPAVVRPAVRSFHAGPVTASLPRVAGQGRLLASAGLLAGGSALLATGYEWSKPMACEPAQVPPPPMPETETREEAKSIVNLYQLSFGTICGLCAGIFIKKGFKLIAVLLGGVYVLLQYLASRGFVRINWNSLEGTYNSTVDSLAGPVKQGTDSFQRYPLVRIWHRLVDFLTTDFQQRATFIAGLVLGLRLG